MPRLTRKLVEAATVPGNDYKDYIIFDDELKGFGLRVRGKDSCRKSFIVQYRHGIQIRRYTIGTYPAVNMEKARAKALKLLAAVADGDDPAGEKRTYDESSTVHELSKRYLTEHCQTHLKPSTQRNVKCLLDKHIIPAIGNCKVVDVSRTDISNLHHKMATTPVNANRTLEVLSKMFNLAEIWGLRNENTNPRRGIKKFPEKRRTHYLSKEEAERLGRILFEMKHYPDENIAAIYCFTLLSLTGCRRNEILTLKWEYIDYENQCLNLPDSKTGAKKTIIGKVVLDLLKEIASHPARPPNNPYVIWGQKEGEHAEELRKVWDRVCTGAGLKEFRMHDMRHSFASFALNGDITSLHMIGSLLGHTHVQTTAGYAHLLNTKQQQAANDVSAEISEIMGLSLAEKQDDVESNVNSNDTFVSKTSIVVPVCLTSDQAAEYLDVRPRLMENWRWRKIGPPYEKLGNRIRYNQTDLDAFRKERTVIAE